MRKIGIVRFFFLICGAGMIGGCVATSPIPPNRSIPDPSDPAAPQASAKPLRPNLVATTKVYIDPSIGKEAQKMEHGNMQGMGGMQGMDQSQMQGMEKTNDSKMQGMDHSKMPGMQPQQQPSPTAAQQSGDMQGKDHSKMQGMDHSKMPGMTSPPQTKEVLEQEMKRTSDEMKKTDEAMKEKSDEMKPGAAVYTCVMHPEVKSDEPGNCPKCGMKLVPKSAAP